MRRLLSERYRERLAGVLSCYDRIIVTGTLPGVCYAKGMTAFLSARQIRIFDYPRFAEPLRDSLTALAHILLGCNRRYLEYLSSLDDFSAGIRALDRLTQPRPVNGRTLRGLNFFSHAEQTLLAALQRPAFNIAGLRRADLLPWLTPCSPATLTRHLARLRQLRVIKRVTGTYLYYLTRAGRAAIAAGRRLTEHTIIPTLAK